MDYDGTCTVCGSEKGKFMESQKMSDTLCNICGGWFLVECQRRTGFGRQIVVVMEKPDDGLEPGVVIGKPDPEPVN
jgi:hypothetical protein